MSFDETSTAVGRTTDPRKFSGAVIGGALAVGWAAAPFIAAGTVRWSGAWRYIVVLVVGLTLHRVYVSRRNPELLARRRQMGAGTRAWDKVWNAIFWPLMVSIPVVGGIDVVRLHGPGMAPALFVVGAAIFSAGIATSAWAMGTNPFFEGTVRIQKERGHRVVSTGPYRHLRHPGYAGLILWALGTPFLVGSWWSLVPAGATAGWVVIRTALEDRTLRSELEGYREYAERVRYRLLPGAW